MSATRQFRGSEWCSALEQFRQATASGESSENVRAYSATTKRIVVHNQFASLERHNSFGKCRPQPRWGVGGWGPRSGPGSLGREPASIYIAFNVRDIDISQVNQRVLSCTDNVAL